MFSRRGLSQFLPALRFVAEARKMTCAAMPMHTSDSWSHGAVCGASPRDFTLPGEPEVHCLLAVIELQASRTAARRGRKGEAVLLRDQNRSL